LGGRRIDLRRVIAAAGPDDNDRHYRGRPSRAPQKPSSSHVPVYPSSGAPPNPLQRGTDFGICSLTLTTRPDCTVIRADSAEFTRRICSGRLDIRPNSDIFLQLMHKSRYTRDSSCRCAAYHF
jgi:hypothetical protein